MITASRIKIQISYRIFFLSVVMVFLTASCELESKLKDSNLIVSFELPNADNEIRIEFNPQEEVIQIFVPYGYELPQTIPVIEISENATLSPTIDKPLSVDKLYKLTITSESGMERTYTIEIIVQKNSKNSILSFMFPDETAAFDFIINDSLNTISGLVPGDYNLTEVSPLITISENSILSPLAEITQDFSEPFTYIVTAENGDIREYVVLAKIEKRVENFINSFVINTPDGTIIGSIDQDERHIIFEAPNEFDLSAIQAEIELSVNATLSSETSQLLDYEKAQTLEVIAENGTTRTYTVGSYSSNLLINAIGNNNGEFWNLDYNSGTEMDPDHGLIFYIVAEDGSSGPRIQQDIVFQKEYEDKYIMFVATITTEKTAGISITRRPYLWAHQKGDFDYDIKYIMQGNMIHRGIAKEWEVAHNTFSLFPETTYVDFKMGQGLRNGDPYDGTKSKYRKVEARIFDSKELADTYIELIYKNRP